MFCIAVVDSFRHWGHCKRELVVFRASRIGCRDSGKEWVVTERRVERVRDISSRHAHWPGGMKLFREEGVGNAGRESAWKGVWFSLLLAP